MKSTTPELDSVVNAELQKWLELLLQLIDVTADMANEHLKKFIKGKGVIKNFQHEIRHIVSNLYIWKTIFIHLLLRECFFYRL